MSPPVSGLTISHNTIGLPGTSNPWNYRSDGPNTHGIVLSPGGEYSNTSISENDISDNLRSGIYAAGGVKGIDISGNILSNNETHGIEFVTGDFTGTTITRNTIAANSSGGISLGAGIGQGERTGENPLNGYSGDGHYVLPYYNQPDFYSPSATQPVIPNILMQIGDVGGLTINLDTGSRGLYVDALQLGQGFAGSGTVLGPPGTSTSTAPTGSISAPGGSAGHLHPVVLRNRRGPAGHELARGGHRPPRARGRRDRRVHHADARCYAGKHDVHHHDQQRHHHDH